MSGAIKPDAFFAGVPSFAKDNIAKKKGVGDEERQLMAMSNTAGWKVMREFIERLSGELDNVNNVAIEKGASFEEIGKNTIVINLTKGALGRIIHKVDDAKEACEK